MSKHREGIDYEQEKVKEPIFQKISQIFLGETGLYKYDGFLKRQLVRSGLSQEQLQTTHSFVRWAEANHVVQSHERNPKTNEYETISKEYRVTTADILKIVDIVKKVDNLEEFSKLVFSVVDIQGFQFDKVLDLLSEYAEIENVQEILSELSTFSGIDKQSIYKLKIDDEKRGLKVSNYENGHYVDRDELVTHFSSLEADIPEIFSEEHKARYAILLQLFKDKSRSSSGGEFNFSPEDIPILFKIISDDSRYDLFLNYYNRVYDIYKTSISAEFVAFEGVFQVIPEIAQLNDSGFDVSRYIGSMIGNYSFRNLLSEDLSPEELREKSLQIFTSVPSLQIILADTQFCSNAKALSKYGMNIEPIHNTRYVNEELRRYPEFYEVRPTKVVEKIGAFFQSGYQKLGFSLPSGSSLDGYLYVLGNNYTEFESVFDGIGPESIQSRMALVPENFYQLVYRKDNVSYNRNESFFLLKKILSFGSDDEFSKWIQVFVSDENVEAIHSQEWLEEYSKTHYIHDFSASKQVITYLFESENVENAVDRMNMAASKKQELTDLIKQLEDKKIKLYLSKVENIVRLTEYTDAQKISLVKILAEYSSSESKMIHDNNFEMIDLVLEYPEETSDKVSALFEKAKSDYLSLGSLFSPYETVNAENVRFLFDNISLIESGYSVLESLIPRVISSHDISGISKYNFGPFIRNLHAFGKNPDLTQTLALAKETFNFRFELDKPNMGDSLLVFSEKPQLIEVAKELKDKSKYFDFDPRDHEAFSVLQTNKTLLKRILDISESASYSFKGEDIGELQKCLDADDGDEKVKLIVFFGKNFSQYKFSAFHAQFFESINNFDQIAQLSLQLKGFGYDFSPYDLPVLSEITNNAELQSFILQIVSLGVRFGTYDTKAYSQLMQKKDEVISFLNQNDMHGDILSSNIRHFEESLPENLPAFLKMVVEIETSQSQDIRTLKKQLIEQLRHAKNPDIAWKEIEAVFVKNHLPLVGKVFKIFEIIYPSEKVDEVLEAHPATSPHLRNSGKSRRRYTIYRDLLNSHLKTGNRSLEQYLITFNAGSVVCQKYEDQGFDSLSESEKSQLHEFLDRAQTLYANSSLGLIGKTSEVAKSEEINDPISDNGFSQRLDQLKEAVGVKLEESLFDRLNEMYARPLGKESLSDLLDEMHKSRKSADKRGRDLYYEAQSFGGKMNLDIGNYLKAVNEQYYHLIGQNGSVSQEFLGPSAGSDLTPLDTDLSIIPEEHVFLEAGRRKEFKEILSSSISAPGSYGNLVFVMRDRGQFNHTDTQNAPEKLPKIGEKEHKPELFKTGVLGETHYGIRTGFPITDVDFMIFGDKMEPSDKSSVLLEIAKNGYYVPVVDEEGTIVFTPEQFDELRKIFSGIPHISSEHVVVDMSEVMSASANLDILIDDGAEKIAKSRERIEKQTKIIFDLAQETLKELGIKMLDPRSGSLLGARLENTGSTARGTNSIGDADFDMLLFLDALDYDKREAFKTAFIEKLSPETDSSYSDSEFLQIRVKGIKYLGLEDADIDLGLMPKSDERGFASHDASSAKLADIRENRGQEVHDKVLSNIVYAKNYLKGSGAYGAHIGCLFGIALENLVLQNDGNFVTAFRRFVEAANKANMSFETFKKEFQIWDPGKGARAQQHGNYIEGMTESGFKQTYRVMRTLLESSLGVPF